MKFLEKDLEEIIFYSDQVELHQRGLYINGLIKRQLRIGNYGIADLVTFEKKYYRGFLGEMLSELIITVYELKKDAISVSAVLQAIEYAKGISRYLELRGVIFKFKIDIVVIGSKLPPSGALPFLPDVFEGVELYTYEYKIDGLFFNITKDYILTEEGFKL